MKLLFKQRLFSWFDSYDIYNENGDIVYRVEGKLSLGHLLEIYDHNSQHIGTIKQELLTFLPKFSMYINDQYIGQIKKEFTFFKPIYTLDYNGWIVEGDIFEWDYSVRDSNHNNIMSAYKQWLNFTDTYTIEIQKNEDALISLMIVLAIDAAKCSQK